ncbi:MAG: complex I subunit 5 family protein [Halobacteriaceae archaeon]
MTTQFIIAPLVIVLLTAVLTLLTRWNTRVQITLSIMGMVGYCVSVGILVMKVLEGEIIIGTYQVGNWPAPFGITLVADALSVFMLSLTAVVGTISLLYSIRYIDLFGQRVSFHSLFHFMIAGATGAFLTGDIFNLFVWFEVMLMASYVLVVFYGGPDHTEAAFKYLILNLFGSAIMLLAIGGIYATTGTLNMADISRRLAMPMQYSINTGPILGLASLLFIVFALKAGLVPFHFWAPETYQAAPVPVAAVLTGIVKKVGVYAIIRLYFTIFATASIPSLEMIGFAGSTFLAFFGPILFLMATGSILVGGIGAIDQDTMEGLLAYSSISQVGFIVLPLAIGASTSVGSVRILAIGSALIYTFNHGVAKALLFLITGTIKDRVGTSYFNQLGNLSNVFPIIAASFFIGGITLIGLPPLTGFFAKVLIFNTAIKTGSTIGIAIALLGAVFTLIYVSRAWQRAFWGSGSQEYNETSHDNIQILMIAVLAIVIIGFGLGFDLLYQFARDAAIAAINRHDYITAVLGGKS